ncbi:MAG: hypothetical protein AAGI88_22405, partial [Pseudomonadota bacterium]
MPARLSTRFEAPRRWCAQQALLATSFELVFLYLFSAVVSSSATLAQAGDVLVEESISRTQEQLRDWVRTEELPEELRDFRCRLCGGRYIDPQSKLNTQQDPDTAPIEASAKQTELRGDTVTLTGGVEVTQGYREFQSDEASINRESRAGTLEGNITLREPGVLLRGERGEFYSRSGEAQLENSLFVLHQENLRGSAELLSRDADELIRIEGGEV